MSSPWEHAERLELQAGDILMREGETTDAVFEVVDGTLEVLRGDPMQRIDIVGPARCSVRSRPSPGHLAGRRSERSSLPSCGGSTVRATRTGWQPTSSA